MLGIVVGLAGVFLAGSAAVYSAGAAVAVLRHRRQSGVAGGAPRGVSVLKPLHGAEPGLLENLRTFATQDYPEFELLCGVADPQDGAIPIVRQLQRELPERRIELVIDPRQHGTNRKVSNLINLLPHARHEWLVLADSDIFVPAGYLRRVATPLADHTVGLVTCIYRARTAGRGWSAFSGRFIDEWFLPSVCVSHLLGSDRFAFGATIALRRDTLQAAGGFESVRDVLADDFWLGDAVQGLGLRTVLSEVVVETDVTETSLAQVWHHEFRWMRTISTAQPLGFAGAFVTFGFPILALGFVLAPTPLTAGIAVAGAVARLALFALQRRCPTARQWLLEAATTPLRDLLLISAWIAAEIGAPVRWRGQVFDRDAQRRRPGAGASLPEACERADT